MVRVFSIVILLLPQVVVAQNYVDYFKTINSIDSQIVQEDYSSALDQLNQVYDSYDFIYARHCFKAVQVAIIVEDTFSLERWLLKSAEQGVPLWFIKQSDLTSKAFQFMPDSFPSTYKLHESKYLLQIDNQLAEFIDSLLAIDQYYTKRVNETSLPLRYSIRNKQWKKNNAIQYAILDSLIRNVGYPGEKILGLPKDLRDSSLSFNFLMKNGPSEFRNDNALIMLIHYFSDFDPKNSDLLKQELYTGNLSPRQYGILQDFLAKQDKQNPYYNVWHHDPDDQNITEINKRRTSIGLKKYELQQAQMKDLIDRKKDNSLHLVVTLE